MSYALYVLYVLYVQDKTTVKTDKL